MSTLPTGSPYETTGARSLPRYGLGEQLLYAIQDPDRGVLATFINN